ncbi:hypothetical protein RB623_16055 [Mesorhizobium sp. LHD-90]|uniref:hypothetical protein n=1 Tax=Mesorhizobium sp. LHD-90 TaxID=3071414 RepID=UPI0027DFF098|nr:hypothetical protein [Mesorhizobium sp. LHD-90]MDQ6435572.1 hypothetical protein [Mesorhizobium sp. LHD-90]
MAMLVAVLALIVAITIGLCLFARWSRPAALALTALGLAAIAFSDPSANDGYVEALSELSSLLTGAVLAAAYWSPVGRLFEPGSAEADLESVFS